MIKKLLLVFGLMMALSVAPLALAQTPANEAEAMAAFAKEGPLTQKDIDGYLALLSKAKETTDPAQAEAILKEVGFTEVRAGYVYAKINYALMGASAGDQADAMLAQVPDVLKPSKEEIALVSNNMDKIQKAMAAMAATK